jgi:hypothetical protein
MVSSVRSAINLALAVGLLAASPGDGRAQAQAKHETFTAKTINMSVGAGQNVKIDVFRWSTEDERNALVSAVKGHNDKAVADALQKAASLGSIWTNENLGYSIRYAVSDTTTTGMERVVVLTDSQLGSWSGQSWKPIQASANVTYPFSLIELRVNRAGTGEGKMSLAGTVIADENAKTLTLGDYDAAPVLLRPVKRESEHQQ